MASRKPLFWKGGGFASRFCAENPFARRKFAIGERFWGYGERGGKQLEGKAQLVLFRAGMAGFETPPKATKPFTNRKFLSRRMHLRVFQPLALVHGAWHFVSLPLLEGRLRQVRFAAISHPVHCTRANLLPFIYPILFTFSAGSLDSAVLPLRFGWGVILFPEAT